MLPARHGSTRALLFSSVRATPSLSRRLPPIYTQTRHAAQRTVSPTRLEASNPVAQQLADTGVWGRKRSGLKFDRHRVNVVSPELCADVLSYLGPSLQRHRGCDLIDINPGAGVWSTALHDAVAPRSHLLLEPDEGLYRPLLKPLLGRPGVRLIPKSGLVWEHLSQVLAPEFLPHQTERPAVLVETPRPTDELLVTVNLSMFPKRRFLSFDSMAQLVLFQLISAIRPGSLYNRYGLVRLLIWIEDQEKMALVPRMVQERKRLAMEADLTTELVTEVAGSEQYVTRLARDKLIDLDSARATLWRMRQVGIEPPPGRASSLITGVADTFDSEAKPTPVAMERRARSWGPELEQLEAENAANPFEKSSPRYKRMKSLRWLVNFNNKRGETIDHVVSDLKAVEEAYQEAGSDEALLAKAAALEADWQQMAGKLETTLRSACLLNRDNLHMWRQDPPVLSWDRRPFEPLTVRPDEFFPNHPCALLDVQPRAVEAVLCDMGPRSGRAGDTLDLILRSIAKKPTESLERGLDAIWPGAAEHMLTHCPSLKDPRRGGSPVGGHGALTGRLLNRIQMVEMAEAWKAWPFAPSFVEVVSRVMDGESDTQGENEDDLKLARKGMD